MATTTTSYSRPLAALVAFAASMVALLLVFDASPAHAAAPVCTTTATGTTTCAYASTGAQDTFTVPTGISNVHVEATGAPGAVGFDGLSAGRGARVSGNLKVTPGDTLYVNVGGAPTGAPIVDPITGEVSNPDNCYLNVDCVGGFNGGGSGDFGGGGGGASDVRTVSRDQDGSLDSRLIVAAGGGGSGEGESCGTLPNGGAGGDAGSDGGQGATCSIAGGTGGGAGGQSSGGLGGLGIGGRRDGGSGSLGQGGYGGSAAVHAGGAGGGGLYGGGGGGSHPQDFQTLDFAPAGGGGGGSSLVPTGGSGPTITSDNPSVTISYSLDTTPPSLTVTHTADGTGGWHITSPVNVNVSASDSGSGLAADPTCKDGTTDLPLTAGSTAGTWTASVSGEGSHNVVCSVSDGAGYTTTTARTVMIDTKAPTISDLGPTAGANGSGWYNADVTNRFQATDSGSGLSAACLASFADTNNTQSKITSGEGTAVNVTSDGCTDVAGNTAKGIDSATFNIDKTEPTIVASAKKADGSAYTAGTWTNQRVTVSYTCSDEAGSGVASCPADQTFSADGADQSASGTATDNAGKTASATFGDIDIDRTRPSVTCDVASPGPTFVLGGTGGNVTATVTDATSKPTATSLSGAANVSSVGNKSISLTGSDNAGNSTMLSCPYTVGYDFLGPFSPIPHSTYQVGSTIPVKFALATAAGSRITDAAARTLVTSPCKVKVSFNGGTKNCAAYNATTDTFQYDLKIPKNLSSGTYKIDIEVSAANGSVVNKESVEVTIRR